MLSDWKAFFCFVMIFDIVFFWSYVKIIIDWYIIDNFRLSGRVTWPFTILVSWKVWVRSGGSKIWSHHKLTGPTQVDINIFGTPAIIIFCQLSRASYSSTNLTYSHEMFKCRYWFIRLIKSVIFSQIFIFDGTAWAELILDKWGYYFLSLLNIFIITL